MRRKSFRGVVLTLSMAVCYLAGVFFVYTGLFAAFNLPGHPTLLAGLLQPGVGTRVLGGIGYVIVGMAFGAILDLARELEMVV